MRLKQLMKKKTRKPRKQKEVHVTVDVEFVPYPTLEAKREAYRTHAKLFLKVKGRVGKGD